MLTRLLLLALSAAALPAQAMPPPPPVVVVVCTPLNDELTRLQLLAEKFEEFAIRSELLAATTAGTPAESVFRQRASAFRQCAEAVLNQIKTLEKSLP